MDDTITVRSLIIAFHGNKEIDWDKLLSPTEGMDFNAFLEVTFGIDLDTELEIKK